MAGDWMKIEKCTPDKPEVFAIADRLGLDPDAVFGKCFRVWCWFDAHTTNGKTNGACVSRSLVDRQAGVSGFADAMVESGWLLELEGCLQVPNFDRHNGETSKQRALTAKRVAKHDAKTNAGSVRKLTPGALGNALPREEKRRSKKPPAIPLAGDCLEGSASSKKVVFAEWVEKVKAAGEKAISDYAPVWEYADRVKLPHEFVAIAWVKFRERHLNDEKGRIKRYADWRRVFRNAVEGNWFRLWFWSERDRCFMLTTAGIQADKDSLDPAGGAA